MEDRAWDSETDLIGPARHAPTLVCISHATNATDPAVEHHSTAEPLLRKWLEDESTRHVCHNGAFDFGVIAESYPHLRPLIFCALDQDRVTDTQLRQYLLDTAAGCYRGRWVRPGVRVQYNYHLSDLAKRLAGITKDGEDPWRLRYRELLDVPVAMWPPEAVAYCLNDARATLAVHNAQERHAVYLKNQYFQTRAYFALHLSSSWGLRTDEPGIEALGRHVDAEIARLTEILLEEKLVREDGTRDTKAAKAYMLDVCRRENIPITRTKAHEKCPLGDACTEHVGLDASTCEDTEDPILIAYAERTTLSTLRNSTLKELARGVIYPIHTRYGYAETGRTTSSGPPIQNLSTLEGVREIFVPRPGCLFAEADYPGLELYTFAQCCIAWFGYSKLAEALNAGLDPHLMMAATILRMPYAECVAIYKDPSHPRYDEVKTARHAGKQVNFGLPGGMGDRKFIKTCRKQMTRAEFLRMDLTLERVAGYRRAWFETWPETKPHFARVRELCKNGEGTVESLFSHRTRGGASYCAAANNGFQALGSDCAKEALWRVACEQYVPIHYRPGMATKDWHEQDPSPLWNTRTVAFIHDELILEVPNDSTAHDAAMRLATVMVEAANKFLPDVPIKLGKMEPLLMDRWAKAAKSTFDSSGRLVPWRAAA